MTTSAPTSWRPDAPGIHLAVDAGTHSGTITRLQVIPGTSMFVTAGNDKRIRVWQARPEPTLVRSLVGDIGPGRDGEVEALAVHPGTGRVWASVRRTPVDSTSRRSELRQFDPVGGDLLYAVDSVHPINDLAFTPDGRFLIVACPGTLQILDVVGVGTVPEASPVLQADVSLHSNPSRVALVDLGDRTRIFVTSIWLPQPRLIDLVHDSDGSGPNVTDGPVEQAAGRIRPDQIAASDRFVAVANHDGGPLTILDVTGRPVTSIEGAGGDAPSELAFSPDGHLLIVGSKAADNAVVTVHDADNGFAVISRRSFDDLAHAVGFLDDLSATGAPIAVAAGGSRFSIAAWPSVRLAARPGEGDVTARGADDLAISGAGRVITALGIAESSVALGSSPERELELDVDLRTLTVKPVDDGGYRRAVHADGTRTLTMGRDHNLRLEPLHRPLTGHNSFAWDYAESFSLIGDDHVVTGGRSGAVRVLYFDNHGELRGRKLVGHVGPVLDLAADDRWLVTGGRDQVARLWYLDDATTESPTPDDNADALEPALNVFVADREWVIWTRSGFYASSAEGERFISFHANRGFGRRAWAFPADRFVDLLYRPDVIRAVFETGSEAAALTQLGLDAPNMADHLPPVVEADQVIEVEPYLFRLGFSVFDLAEPATRVWVLQDGLIEWEVDLSAEPTPIGGARAFDPQFWLEPGRNELRILAESGAAKSIAVDLVVEVDDYGHQTVAIPSELSSEVIGTPMVAPVSTAGTTGRPSPVPVVPLRPIGSPDVTVGNVNVSVEIACEPGDGGRRLRADVDGDHLWTVDIAAGAALAVTATMPTLPADGIVRVVDESGGGERPVFVADIRAAMSPVPEAAQPPAVGHLLPPSAGQPFDSLPLAVDPGHPAGLSIGDLSVRSKGDDGDTTGGDPNRSPPPGRPTRVAPELFLLAVGVSKLKTKGQSVGDLNYAAADANAVAQRFKTGSADLFHKVHSWTLTDTEATKAGIGSARDELVAAVESRCRRKEAERLKARDVVLLFFSGHGVARTDPGGGRDDFYLVTHDFLSDDAAGTGVLFADLVQPFFALRDFELVVLVDSCRSGHAGLDFIERVDPEELARRLKAPSEQAQHFLCSTSGDQLSFEYKLPYPRTRTPVGHGLFTHAIIKQMETATTVSMSGLAAGVGEALDIWTAGWESRQEPTQYLYGGGKYLRLYKRR